jgi:hypothetical protein
MYSMPEPTSSCVRCEHFRRYDDSYHTCTAENGLMLMTVMDNTTLCPADRRVSQEGPPVSRVDQLTEKR